MPHLNIKHFRRDFPEEQQYSLAEALTAVVVQHFDTYDGAVSIALEPVAESDWNEAVMAAEVIGREHLLIKAPSYHTT